MKAIIVEDEKKNITQLKRLLEKYCRQVDVIGEALNAREGAAMINELKPDLVFLDIQMPKESGFDMLASLGVYEFDVIFITGYDQYGIQAVKCSALDYLLKPVQVEELVDAVNKAELKRRNGITSEQIANVQTILRNPQKQQHKIIIQDDTDFHFLKPYDILRLEASGNYTRLYFTDGKMMLISKGIGVCEELFSDYGFIRPHQSHLVNTRFIKSFYKGKVVFELLLTDGFSVPVSSRKRDKVRTILIRERK
ncbi:MAG: LytTR family DNA-binding domain-containing protein [Sediminibacterium sp.]